ncbi:hypothetical protein C4K23_0602 [Pseudomonas chlororaphis]|nr:hypothetical protein C4K23_0602 [Pseudomonas chlororaphis]
MGRMNDLRSLENFCHRPPTVQKTTKHRQATQVVARSHMHAPYPQDAPQSLGASAKVCKPLSTGAAGGFRKFFA